MARSKDQEMTTIEKVNIPRGMSTPCLRPRGEAPGLALRWSQGNRRKRDILVVSMGRNREGRESRFRIG